MDSALKYFFVVIVVVYAETKKNCSFELIGNYLKARDGWKLRVVCDEHNHEPSMYMKGHSFAV